MRKNQDYFFLHDIKTGSGIHPTYYIISFGRQTALEMGILGSFENVIPMPEESSLVSHTFACACELSQNKSTN
jgi:hypothetical protein